jgi:hypothetical protein
MDFGTAEARWAGQATAYFAYLYQERIPHNYAPFPVESLACHIRDWGLPREAVRVIRQDGSVTIGTPGEADLGFTP